MGSEAENEQISSTTVPKLSLLLLSNIPQMLSPQHPGMLTPPLHTTTASVPFRWEEEPGKPRPSCTAALTTTNTNITNNNNTTTDTTTTTTTTTTTRCLELPPRLLTEAIITKMPSPTTVLEGPYIGKHVSFGSSSFRFIEDGSSLFGSEKGQLGAMLLSKNGHNKGGKGFFGSSTWGRRGFKGTKRDVVAAGEDSFVFSSFLDTEDGEFGGTGTKVKMTRIRRNKSFLGLSHARSHFLATIYEGLKQAIPWGRRKLKKDNLSV